MIEKCPYCGKDVVRISGDKIYGEKYKHLKMKACEDYPKCDSYSGLGATLAKKELRILRKKCHKIFDEKWKSGQFSRQGAYHWLCKVMGMKGHEAHISLFRVDECNKLLKILEQNDKAQ